MELWKRLNKGRRQRSSRDIAKERLKRALMYDRIKITPDMLQTLKDDLIVVISKHAEIDRDGVQVNFTQSQRQSRLVADIPVSGFRQV